MREKSKDRSLMKKLRDAILRLLRKKSPPEADPYAYVTVPLRRGPKGRSGAAVAEMEDDDSAQTFPPSRIFSVIEIIARSEGPVRSRIGSCWLR